MRKAQWYPGCLGLGWILSIYLLPISYGLRAAETFPSEAGCDTCGQYDLYWRVQQVNGGYFAS